MNPDSALPVWLQPGPAQKYYQRHLEQKPLRMAWVEMIRERWGSPQNPGLSLFPSVQREDRIIPKSVDIDVAITQFTPPDPRKDIFIYIHGGGWVIPASGKHLAYAKRIAHMTNMTVMSVDYRLSPEHAFPAAFHDCLTVYLHARKRTTQPGVHQGGRVFVGGDSAGGNMAAAVALYCADHNISVPDKVLCLSTYADHYFEKYASMHTLGIGNPYVEMSVIAFIRAFYVPNVKDWSNPYASPIYGKLEMMPPTCILVGMEDPLRDDNLAFAQKLNDAGAEVNLMKFDRMPHSFFTYPEILPNECELANQGVVKFMLE